GLLVMAPEPAPTPAPIKAPGIAPTPKNSAPTAAPVPAPTAAPLPMRSSGSLPQPASTAAINTSGTRTFIGGLRDRCRFRNAPEHAKVQIARDCLARRYPLRLGVGAPVGPRRRS